MYLQKKDFVAGIVSILNDLRMVFVDLDARTIEAPRLLHLGLFLIQIVLLRQKKGGDAYGGH